MKKYMILTGEPSQDFLNIAKDLTQTEHIEEAEIIFGEPTHEELERAKELKWVQMTWAGADRYLERFPENVILTTASGAFGETIAEHALAMLFALCRRLPAYSRENHWQDLGCEKSISGATALIFGAGDIGTAIAKRLKSMGVCTIGVCRDLRKHREGFDIRTNLENAAAFLPETDFVLCALPHNKETAGYFNEERLRLMKDDAVLINVGRGSFVKTEALTELLLQGKFFGVGLDVTNPEPLTQDHPLWTMANVIVTPHVAGVGIGHLKSTEERIWSICAENLNNYLQNLPLRNVVMR